MYAVVILNVVLAITVVGGILSILGRAIAVESAGSAGRHARRRRPLASGGVLLAVLAATGLTALTTSSSALASSGGNANAGDVWTDNVLQPAGPGHEQDPHLACKDINLWGSGMADASGGYTIDGWAPSGHQEQDYTSTWSYNAATGGSQVISVINVTTLIKNAAANGDKPVNKQGYHFKLQLSQDPQKHKTFWVNCPAPSTGGPSGGNTGGSQTPPPVVQPTTPPKGSSTGTPPPKTALKATHRHRHRLMHPKRHLKPRRRQASGVTDAAPQFTG
jgi:hypothetical protein